MRYESVAVAEEHNANAYTSLPRNTFGPFRTTNEQMSVYALYVPNEALASVD